jgi:hypothetical protein
MAQGALRYREGHAVTANKSKAEAAHEYNARGLINTARYLWGRTQALLGTSHDGKRDIYDIYGYPRDLGGEAGFLCMFQQSARQGIANRITHGMAGSCWRDGFEVRADPEDEESAQLDDALQVLNRAGLTQRLERADVLNRIGRFSVLLVGVPDGLELREPVGTVRGGPEQLKTVYFQPYAYDCVEVIQWETDNKNPRYGMPVLYTLSKATRRGNEKDNAPITTLTVHYSRIVHLAENALDSDLEGAGALEPIYNRIVDIDKATGGASEAYFRNARRIITTEIDKEFAAGLLSDPAQKASFDESVQKFTNEWQDHITAAGAKVGQLQSTHYSPLDTVKVALWEISGYTGIPIRILTGEGAGQLAGSEDQLAYNHIVADRQRLVCAGWAYAVLEVLQAAGLLKLDPQWSVVFPPQQASTEMQQAEVDARRATTLRDTLTACSSAAGGGVDVASALRAVGLSDVEVDDDLLPVEP